MGARVAVACCRRCAGGPVDDLYPDADAAPLAGALRDAGAEVVLVTWDDPAVEWRSYSHVVVSSTWDSVDRPLEYCAWAERAGTSTRLVNPPVTLLWGLDKRHQRDLAAAGIPLIPTTWVPPGVEPAWPVGDVVVKPCISAGGRRTARYGADDLGAAASHVQLLHDAGETAMVQPYVAAVDVEGEVDIVFVDGVPTHAVGKRPALGAGAGILERPWEHMSWTGLVDPTAAQMEVADRTSGAVGAAVGATPAYCRVDLVTHDGAPVVLEVEVVDPLLSLALAPAAAQALAGAVLAAA